MFDSEDDHFVAMAFLCEEVDARIRTDRDASRAQGRLLCLSGKCGHTAKRPDTVQIGTMGRERKS